MLQMLVKDLARKTIPRPVAYGLKRQITLLRARDAMPIFEHAARHPEYLEDAALEELADRFRPPPALGYGPEDTARRGRSKAQTLRKAVRSSTGPVTSLELGCWDGMASGVLAQDGWTALGVDIRDVGFDARAQRAGATLRQMDARNLDFPDNTFDLVFSFDAFEHFGDPGAVLAEAIRVTRDGGSIFLGFGPLYNSPYGLHAYRSVAIPYCQFLFTPDQLNGFTGRRGLAAIDFEQVNRWPLARFRALWQAHRHHMIPKWYFENYTSKGLDLVAKYPTCFRSKVDAFDELLVTSIHALFQVRK